MRRSYQTGFVESQVIPSTGWTASKCRVRIRYAVKAAIGMSASSRQAGCHLKTLRLDGHEFLSRVMGDFGRTLTCTPG